MIRISKRWSVGFHRNGNCWTWKPERIDHFYSGQMVWYSWWRFYAVRDNRFAVVN